MTSAPENNHNKCWGACGISDAPFLFPIRHKVGGGYRRFCTACFLKSHTGSFCPICFEVFSDRTPLPSHLRVICFNCSSVSHTSCVNPASASSSARYRCPPCSDSNFAFFNLSSRKNKKSKTNVAAPTPQATKKEINEYLSKQLLAAAQIAANAMNKAAAHARMESEKRVQEAVIARKRAVDSLSHLASKSNDDDNAHMDRSLCLTQNHLRDNSSATPRRNAPSVVPKIANKDSNGR